jgi:putative ABC transport system substrate-binding protein
LKKLRVVATHELALLVATGLVSSLARPDANVTGSTARAQGPSEFDRAFEAMAESHADSVVVTEDGEFAPNFPTIGALALKNRLPSIGAKEYGDAGGLIGYGANILALYRRAAYFVDRILKGAKPADLPVEQPTKFELVVNLRTAKALGQKIPETFLVRADEVID